MWNLNRITSALLLFLFIFVACGTASQEEDVSKELLEVEKQMEESAKKIKEKTDAVEAEIEELLKDI